MPNDGTPTANGTRFLRICIILMQKNEGALLSAWLRYHLRMADAADIVIVDNGSTDPDTLAALAWGEQQGVFVDRSFPAKADYENKHNIVTGKIQAAQQNPLIDFTFPLDADEFLVTIGDNNEVSPDPDALRDELGKYVEAKGHLKLAGSYYNNHTEVGTYFFYREPGVFFCREPIRSVDHGYHNASTIAGNQATETKVAVVHFQYKRLELAKVYAVEKLKNRVKDFGVETLRAYNGNGSHMTKYFLCSAREYQAMLVSAGRMKLSVFEAALVSADRQFPYEMFFATDRYSADRSHVSQSRFLPLLKNEGWTLEELCLIFSYAKHNSFTAVYRESALVPFLFRADVWHISVIANNRTKLNDLIESFELLPLILVSRCQIFHVEMGETDEHGYPIDTSNSSRDRYAIVSPGFVAHGTQLVIVNGRYRVSVLLGLIARMTPDCLYIVPDFWSRPHYHSVLAFFDMVDTEDDAVVLRRISSVDDKTRMSTLAEFRTDSR